ncbi:hypothetical protein KHHGKMAE_2675 [Methylobacterium persicinum]|nr:hypothetical protein KHHGKMAE_2675 [Methylobacterium persicinum]
MKVIAPAILWSSRLWVWEKTMIRTVAETGTPSASAKSGTGIDTGHLGQTLRRVYEGSIDTQPIPDSQIDLLLRLRHKERDRRQSL